MGIQIRCLLIVEYAFFKRYSAFCYFAEFQLNYNYHMFINQSYHTKTDSHLGCPSCYYLLSTANISSHLIMDLCEFSIISVKNKKMISITVLAETLEKQNSSRKSFSRVAVVI